MEFDELKSIWSSQMASEFQRNKHSHEQINAILMKNKNTFERIKKNNKFWLVWVYIAAPITLLNTIANVILRHTMPEKFAHYNVGYNLIILMFILLVTLVYYVQYKIFDFSLSATNLETALQKATTRFRDFYKVSTGIWVIFFPCIFFVIIDMLTNISIISSLPLSLVISVIALWINHIYYKKTYFKWIENMESNLSELKEGS